MVDFSELNESPKNNKYQMNLENVKAKYSHLRDSLIIDAIKLGIEAGMKQASDGYLGNANIQYADETLIYEHICAQLAKEIEGDSIHNRANAWIVGNDTGMSSEAIWAHMQGVSKPYYEHPGDPADLGRCLRLLKLIPEWKPRIYEMSKHSKEWAVFTAHWDELEHMMDQEVGIDWSKGKSAPKTFKRMCELRGI